MTLCFHTLRAYDALFSACAFRIVFRPQAS